MYLLIITLPLFGAMFTGFTGRWLGHYGAAILSTSCVIITFFISLSLFYEVGLAGTSCFITLFTWIWYV